MHNSSVNTYRSRLIEQDVIGSLRRGVVTFRRKRMKR